MINKPDYDSAAIAAMKILIERNITETPVNPLPILLEYPNVRVLPFTKMATDARMERKDLVPMFASNQDAATFHLNMPEMENVTVGFSCDENATSMTFDLTKEDNFTESEYNQFVSALSAKLGNGTDESDEYQKRTTWTDGEKLWDVTWDLTTGLAVNIG